MKAHKLTIEGRWGYCVCGWSTGPAGAVTFDDTQDEINEDHRAHLRQRAEQADEAPPGWPEWDDPDDWEDQ